MEDGLTSILTETKIVGVLNSLILKKGVWVGQELTLITIEFIIAFFSSNNYGEKWLNFRAEKSLRSLADCYF